MPAPIVPAPATPSTGHRPWKSGLRFSMKADMPSTRSSVAIASSYRRRSCSRPAVSPVRRRPARPAWRAARRAAAGAPPPRPARAPFATLLRPPVYQPEPVRLAGVNAPPGEHQLHRALLAHHPRQPLGAAAAGMIPSRISGWPNSASPRPRSCRTSAPARRRRRARSRTPRRRAACGIREPGPEARGGEVSTSWNVRSAMALMSAPAANYSSLPAITMQRTPGSASHPRSAASSSITSGESALRASGRLSRATPTAPRISADTVAITYHRVDAVRPRPMISFWICEVPSYRSSRARRAGSARPGSRPRSPSRRAPGSRCSRSAPRPRWRTASRSRSRWCSACRCPSASRRARRARARPRFHHHVGDHLLTSWKAAIGRPNCSRSFE